MEYQQMSMFDFLKEPEQTISCKQGILNVGNKIGRVVLGECRIATITEVEGLPRFPFYRTDSGRCYSYEDGLKSIDDLLEKAESERIKYETITPQGLAERITVVYPPRRCDGKVLWAQIGIFQGMLFWKESITFQFLERCKDEKDLQKKYKEHKDNIMSDYNGSAIIVNTEHEMRRLYASKCANGYADAEYVLYNK